MKNLSRYIIITLAILIAELVGAYILMITEKYKGEDHPYRSAMIQMAVAVVTFYPTVILVEKYMKNWSKTYLEKIQKMASNKLFGLLLGFLIALLLILMAFVKVLYDRSMIDDIGNWFEQII